MTTNMPSSAWLLNEESADIGSGVIAYGIFTELADGIAAANDLIRQFAELSELPLDEAPCTLESELDDDELIVVVTLVCDALDTKLELRQLPVNPTHVEGDLP
jgi:hypothetical protein